MGKFTGVASKALSFHQAYNSIGLIDQSERGIVRSSCPGLHPSPLSLPTRRTSPSRAAASLGESREH